MRNKANQWVFQSPHSFSESPPADTCPLKGKNCHVAIEPRFSFFVRPDSTAFVAASSFQGSFGAAGVRVAGRAGPEGVQ